MYPSSGNNPWSQTQGPQAPQLGGTGVPGLGAAPGAGMPGRSQQPQPGAPGMTMSMGVGGGYSYSNKSVPVQNMGMSYGNFGMDQAPPPNLGGYRSDFTPSWNPHTQGTASAAGKGKGAGFAAGLGMGSTQVGTNGFSSTGFGSGFSNGPGPAGPPRGAGFGSTFAAKSQFEDFSQMTPQQYGKKIRAMQQEDLKSQKAYREAEYFWSLQRQNVEIDRQRGGPPRKSTRRLQEEELELFGSTACQGTTAGIDFSKYDEIEVERNGFAAEHIPVLETFEDLEKLFHMPPIIISNLTLCKYSRPTPVQKHAIPTGLCGRDVMCCAQTGSGKTCAFMLPVIACLDPNAAVEAVNITYEGPACPKAVVLAPTRELCTQIHNEARKFCHRSPFRDVQIYGGVDAKTQLQQLARGCDILTATPGRLIDFIDRGVVSMRLVQHLVLDEADRMLDMGFEPQIRLIVEQRDMPSSQPKFVGDQQVRGRQTLMFSATFPKEMQQLAQDFLLNYVWIAVGRVGGAAETVTQRIIPASPQAKPQILLELLKEEQNSDLLTLVFVARKRTAAWLARMLRMQHNVAAADIHGDLSQAERERALQAFKAHEVRVLIATDVASRGLDIPAVQHVINYDLPSNGDDYVHRIGRTGRIGNRGTATSFYVSDSDAMGSMEPSNANVLKDLIDILENSHNEVPLFLRDEWQMKVGSRSGGYGFGKGKGKGKGGKGGFSARDIRGYGNFEAPAKGKGLGKGYMPVGQANNFGQMGMPRVPKELAATPPTRNDESQF